MNWVKNELKAIYKEVKINPYVKDIFVCTDENGEKHYYDYDEGLNFVLNHLLH